MKNTPVIILDNPEQWLYKIMLFVGNKSIEPTPVIPLIQEKNGLFMCQSIYSRFVFEHNNDLNSFHKIVPVINQVYAPACYYCNPDELRPFDFIDFKKSLIEWHINELKDRINELDKLMIPENPIQNL